MACVLFVFDALFQKTPRFHLPFFQLCNSNAEIRLKKIAFLKDKWLSFNNHICGENPDAVENIASTFCTCPFQASEIEHLDSHSLGKFAVEFGSCHAVTQLIECL